MVFTDLNHSDLGHFSLGLRHYVLEVTGSEAIDAPCITDYPPVNLHLSPCCLISSRGLKTNYVISEVPAQAGGSNELGVISVGAGAGEGSREAMCGDLHETDLLDIARKYGCTWGHSQEDGLRDGSRENDAQALEAVTPVTHEAGSSSTVPEAAATAEGGPDGPPSAVPPLQPGNEPEAPCGSGGPAHDVLPLVHVCLRAQDQLKTTPDVFGVFHKYFDRPTYDPDGELTLEDLAGLTLPNSTLKTGAGPDTGWEGPEDMRHAPEVAYGPFPNASTFMLSNWYYNSPSGERSSTDWLRSSLIHALCRRIYLALQHRNETSSWTIWTMSRQMSALPGSAMSLFSFKCPKGRMIGLV
ncbi:hypothetical protein JB92DRAFT_2833174 [Gautieria morchelliformis]|nr:hypothetical protein JB92DRAFT_2833174 [Gautieria morchelliformis]